MGINLYSKSAPHTEKADQNLEEMLAAIDEIGLDWATDEESWPGLDSGFNVVPHEVRSDKERSDSSIPPTTDH